MEWRKFASPMESVLYSTAMDILNAPLQVDAWIAQYSLKGKVKLTQLRLEKEDNLNETSPRLFCSCHAPAARSAPLLASYLPRPNPL
jgi:hypothetical protein